MNAASVQSRSVGLRKTATKSVRPRVTFRCYAPNARTVRLVGDFNRWDVSATPMAPTEGGWWVTRVQLEQGQQHCLFLVDGVPTLDLRAQGLARNVCVSLMPASRP